MSSGTEHVPLERVARREPAQMTPVTVIDTPVACSSTPPGARFSR